jgi:hypothetical protein
MINVTTYISSLKFVMPVFVVSGFFSSFVNHKSTDTPAIQLVRTLKYTSLAAGLGLGWPLTIAAVIFTNTN